MNDKPQDEFDCEEIERELKEISPWPWKHVAGEDEYEGNRIQDKNEKSIMCDMKYYPSCPEIIDQEFIFKSPQRLAAAVKRIRDLEKELERLKAPVGNGTDLSKYVGLNGQITPYGFKLKSSDEE